MKTKTNQTTKKRKATRVVCGTPITSITRKQLGRKIGRLLDLMNDPRFKEEEFDQIMTRDVRSTTLSAANSEMFISFTINWKGDKE